MKAVHLLKNTILNLNGFRTNRKIVIIESDDWGSIRMPNSKIYNRLSNHSNYIKNNPYCRFDTIANSEDLNALFSVLLKFKDFKGNPPVFTANTVVGNPDFQKIKENNFTKYYYEPFTETIERYYPNQNIGKLWREGMKEKIFFPQFHGREHLNSAYWLHLLQNKDPQSLKTFNLGCWIIPPSVRNIQASYDVQSIQEEGVALNAVKEGLDLFEKIFGYKSYSFIANNFIWNSKIEDILFQRGVRIIQSMKYQKLPILNSEGKRMLIRHYLGSRNKNNQIYLIRNCVFEPSQNLANKNNDVETCFSEIKNAFFWKKPAIITTHRLNYVGAIDKNNRIKNLQMLQNLLERITQTWPDVEFQTSEELGSLILNESKD